MPYHCVYKYQMSTQRGPTGWSEGFWNTETAPFDATAQARALGQALRLVHSNKALMLGFSVREVSNNPAIKLSRRVSYIAVNETAASASGRFAGMYPTTALRLNLISEDARSNYVYLKGMPDGIDTGGDYTPLLGWNIFMNQLLALLTSAQTSWARRELDPTIGEKSITAITTGGLVSCVGHGLAIDDRVRIGRTFSTPNIDGIYRVVAVADNTFTIVGMPIVDEPPTINESSYARKIAYINSPLAVAEANAVTKKNVGRPFGSPSGRQKTPKN